MTSMGRFPVQASLIKSLLHYFCLLSTDVCVIYWGKMDVGIGLYSVKCLNYQRVASVVLVLTAGQC